MPQTEFENIKNQCRYHLKEYNICTKPHKEPLLCHPIEECKGTRK